MYEHNMDSIGMMFILTSVKIKQLIFES